MVTRLTPTERKTIRLAAALANAKPSTWLRDAGLRNAERVLAAREAAGRRK